MSQAAKYGGLICMHAENGGAIDVIVQQGAGGRKARAEISRADASHDGGRRSHRPRDRAGGDGRRARVYRASFVQRRARKSARGARPRHCRRTRKRARSICISRSSNMDAPGFEGAKYVFTPPLREKWHQEKLWQGLDAGHAAGGLHRSLPVLLQGTEGTRARTISRKFPTAARASSTG